MKRLFFRRFAALTCCGVAVGLMSGLCGCSKTEVPDPPLARAELTVRLGEALKHQRDDEALSLIDKLLALDGDDSDLIEMRSRVIANRCVRAAQRRLDAGNLEEAREIVQAARQQYPLIPRLRMLEEEISGLIDLRNAAAALARARSIPELTTALEVAEPLAAAHPGARTLAADIKTKQAELARLRSAELRKINAAGPAPAPNAPAGPVKP